MVLLPLPKQTVVFLKKLLIIQTPYSSEAVLLPPSSPPTRPTGMATTMAEFYALIFVLSTLQGQSLTLLRHESTCTVIVSLFT